MADYIRRRDGGVEADWRNVMLCAGASEVSDHIYISTTTVIIYLLQL